MPTRHAVTFQEALEIVEALPEPQQEDLVDILRRRSAERRREALAQSVQEAREDLARGKIRRGSAEDLMKELDG